MSNEEARCRRAWVYAEEMRVKVREASGRQPFRLSSFFLTFILF